MNDLEIMQAQVKQVNEDNGWFDSSRTFGDDMALLHSEVSEAFEEFRIDGSCRDRTLSTSYPHTIPKPEGVGSELADILIRLLDTAERYGIDLTYEFGRKIHYNKTRGYRHGGKAV